MINGHRIFRSFSPSPSAFSGSVGRNRTVGMFAKSAAATCIVAASPEADSRTASTGTIPPRLRRAAVSIAFRAASRVRCKDRRYNSPPTVLTTLATPAPMTVPATPSVEPSNAAVTAASAAASTEDMRSLFLSSAVSFCSSLMIPI